MIRLSNRTDQPITATTGHSIPPEGTLDVADATWDRMCQEPYIAGQMRRGNLSGERVAQPAPEPEPTLAEAMSAELADVTLTADDVATMRKAEVIEMLEEMGAEPVDGGVADLRAQLVGLL